MSQRTLVVVLGMHRGGTSAIARMLPVIGISLGDQLLPAVVGDNDRGYWEDVALHEINEAMLAFLGRRWTTLPHFSSDDIDRLCQSGFLAQAVEAIEQKFEKTSRFGFKDPRTARLLPFWKRVFAHCDLDVRYLIAVRNPKSVVDSIVKSRGLNRVLGYHLWFTHLLEGLTGSEGTPRVLVDYDALIQDPERELLRVSKTFDLPLLEIERTTFCSEFLDGGLRHTCANVEEIQGDEASFGLAVSLYKLLLAESQGLAPVENTSVLNSIVRDAALLSSSYPYIGHLEQIILRKENVISEQDGELTSFYNSILETDQARKVQHERAERLQALVSEQALELDHRLRIIEETDHARKDQHERAERLQALVSEQALELDHRLRIIEETDHARKDQHERAERLQALVSEQALELDHRLRIIEETDQARKDQFNDAEKLRRTVEELIVDMGALSSDLNQLNKDKTQWERTRSEQLHRVKELEYELQQADHRLRMIEDTMNRLGLGKRRLKTAFFDSVFYLKTNPDLVLHGVDPVVHFLFHGIFEKRLAVPPKSTISLLLQGVSERGGIGKTTIKAINKARREGIAGVKNAIGKVKSKNLPIVEKREYSEWIQRYDTLDGESRSVIRSKIMEFHMRPLVSVVMPVFNSPPALLEAAIESVQLQQYPNWELCIADDASTDPQVRVLLERVSREDKRIKVVYREKNGHISAASNSAIQLVEGDFIALLDHDDLLPEYALFYVVELINKHPDADVIFSDEDKINKEGERYDPYFKPDFDPLLFLAQNMVSHLGVYRTQLVRDVGGFRCGFEGSQDWDLALRIIEKTQMMRIHHIPKILYHWRAVSGSTALATSEKDYVVSAGRRAVSEHLERTGKSAEVVTAPEVPHLNRVVFDRCSISGKISIIIPTRDKADILSVCVDSIINLTTYDDFEIIVIDNGSVEAATFSLFRSWPPEIVRVISDASPFNFSKLNNNGVLASSGDILCFLNNDIEIISSDWIEEMASFAVQKEVGCVGARLWYPSGELQHAGVLLGVGGIANHAHYGALRGNQGYFGRAVLHQSFSAVTAAALMVRKKVFDSVGGFDENLAVAFNDIDLCLRIRSKGFRNVWTPYAEMIHHESLSRGKEDDPEKLERFSREINYMKSRWGDDLLRDPFYNPNLSLNSSDFDLAWPPRLRPI